METKHMQGNEGLGRLFSQLRAEIDNGHTCEASEIADEIAEIVRDAVEACKSVLSSWPWNRETCAAVFWSAVKAEARERAKEKAARRKARRS